MDAQFWHERWQAREIGFHQNQANALMVAHFSKLGIAPGSRVFVPLCGKTLDIAWLLSQGFAVVGVELAEQAVIELFDELDVTPETETVGSLKRYAADGIDIYTGDIFDLTPETMGPVSAIFDRAAFVALPGELRMRYSRHLTQLSATAPQCLVTFEYDTNLINGPPFSIDSTEIHRHYDKAYRIREVERVEYSGLLQGKCPAIEVLSLLTPAG